MATIRIPIELMPDPAGTAGPFYEPSALNFGSNDRYPVFCFRFADTSTRDKLGFQFIVPKDYVGSAKLILRGSATVTTGNRFRLEADYTAIAAGETGDPSSDQETVAANQAPPGTARLELETSITLTASNFAADDHVIGAIARDGAQASPNDDDVASNYYLFSAEFEYANA